MADPRNAQMGSTEAMVKYAPLIGPIVFMALGYMDPGNWATAIEGGSRFGFELLWVVALSHIMALLFHILATRLELVTGKHLAQICRDEYPQPVCTSLWVLCQISLIASEVTMVLGTAVGLNLLLGIPIVPAVFLSVFDTLVFQVVLPLVGLQNAEVLTRVVIGVILVCFGLDALLSQPNAMVIAAGMLPEIRGDTLYTAMALLGANVMPHTFYLHSPIAKSQIADGSQSVETLCEKSMWDAIGAFALASVANAVLLIVAATSFYNAGLVVLTLQDTHALMEQVFSKSIAPAVFGMAMLCAGQLSTRAGSSGEQATLEGFSSDTSSTMQPWLHGPVLRAAAILLTALCAWHYGNKGLYQLLVFAQALVSLLLPFAALPLIKASTSEARMGSFRMSTTVEAAAWASVALVIVTDIWLVFDAVLQEIDEFTGFAAQPEHLLGTDLFSNMLYGGEMINATVFALVLAGIGLCIGFLVWLAVTPLHVDRIAMERKWVEEYERFERNEVAERLRIGAASSAHYELSGDPKFVDEEVLSCKDNGAKKQETTRNDFSSAWNATSRIGLHEDGSSTIWELNLQLPEKAAIPEILERAIKPKAGLKAAAAAAADHPQRTTIAPEASRTFEDLAISDRLKPAEDNSARAVPEVLENPQESQYGDRSDGTETPFQVVEVVPEEILDRIDLLGSSSFVVEDDLFVELDAIALPEPESQDLEQSELEGLLILTSSESLSAEEPHDPKCAARDLPAAEIILAADTGIMAPTPAGVERPADDILSAADAPDQSTGLKAAESAQADDAHELLEKEDDEVTGWENPQPGDLLTEPMATDSLGASSNSLMLDSPGSVTSVGDRSESSTADGTVSRSRSGSLSHISGLGRAARRQFAAILDDFWSKLFDLHGQPVKQQGSAANGRTAGGRTRGARGGAIQQQQQQLDHIGGSLPGQPGSMDGFERENYGMLLKPKQGFPTKKGSLGDQLGQQDAYARMHSHAGASTSLQFSGHSSHDYSSRNLPESLSPYTSEQKYSSLHFPLYPEETYKQPATIHGYRSPSFLGQSAASPSPAAYVDTQAAFRLSYPSSSGQALPHQPLGIGVEIRESDSGYRLYGARSSLQDEPSGLSAMQDATLQSCCSSQQIVDPMPRRTPLHSRVSERLLLQDSGYGGQSDLGPGSWDSLLNHAALDCLVYRATGELDIPMMTFDRSPVARGAGSSPGETAAAAAAPLSFDQLSPSQSCRNGFSIQSGRLKNHSLWSRQPSEQLFFGALDGSPDTKSVRGGNNNNQASSPNWKINNRLAAVRPEAIVTNNKGAAVGPANLGADFELEVMESLQSCLGKLLLLEGSEWLFRADNGLDEDLVATAAAAEKSKLMAETTAHDQYDSLEQWQPHGHHPVTSLFHSNNESGRILPCTDSCVWGKKGLLISFGVWSVHRLLELSLMESRPELWGKYTYVLNRLQGILEPAFSKPRGVPSLCGCLSEPGSVEKNLSKQQGAGVRNFQDSVNGDAYGPPVVDHVLGDVHAWAAAWIPDPTSSKGGGRGADATIFLEMIKEVEAAVGSRKGRMGTAAGDVAFPKGKENLASVLKRYKRRLTNKPPGSLAVGGGGQRGNGYA